MLVFTFVDFALTVILPTNELKAVKTLGSLLRFKKPFIEYIISEFRKVKLALKGSGA